VGRTAGLEVGELSWPGFDPLEQPAASTAAAATVTKNRLARTIRPET
jgi:hypothetical protein